MISTLGVGQEKQFRAANAVFSSYPPKWRHKPAEPRVAAMHCRPPSGGVRGRKSVKRDRCARILFAPGIGRLERAAALRCTLTRLVTRALVAAGVASDSGVGGPRTARDLGVDATSEAPARFGPSSRCPLGDKSHGALRRCHDTAGYAPERSSKPARRETTSLHQSRAAGDRRAARHTCSSNSWQDGREAHAHHDQPGGHAARSGFGDDVLAAAILDRLLHHSHT